MELGVTKAERRALVWGRAVALFIGIVGILVGSVLLGPKEKSALERLWPPTVAWIGWCVIGVITGNVVRSQIQKYHAHAEKVEQSEVVKKRDLPNLSD